MISAALCRQHALVEPAVACAQYRSVITRQFGGDAQARRHNVPRVQRAEAADGLSCFISFEIDGVEVLTDGAAVVKPDARIDCESFSNRYGVGQKQGAGNELAAA